MMDWLAEFWGDLLSEEPLRIVAAWATLGEEEKVTIHLHLTHMATEEGWSDVQRIAAQSALRAIDDEATPDAENR
jgi:hypothetical protein